MEVDEELGDIELAPLFCDLCEVDFDNEAITLGEVRLARFLVRYKPHLEHLKSWAHNKDYFYCATHWGRALRREHRCITCSLPLTVSEEDPL